MIQCVNILQLQTSDTDHRSFPQGMQIGCKYLDTLPISVGFNGRLALIHDPNHITLLHGHQSPIKAMTLCNRILYTGDTDGNICQYNLDTGDCQPYPITHSATISSLSYTNELISVGWDDTLKTHDKNIKLPSQPTQIVS